MLKGVKQPTKYTESFVIKELKDMLKMLKNDEDIIFILQLFEDKKYTRERFSEWLKTYGDISEVVRLSHTIKEILESRVLVGSMTNKLNATAVIFNLKNNYGYKDKIDIDTNINGKLEIDSSIDITVMSLTDRANYIKRKLLN